ncbi:MAG: S1 RNA-binding domain-containing protein [Myxococcaceae bacterium]
MLGIPSGRGGEREEKRDRGGGDKGGRGPRDEKKAAPQKSDQSEHRGGRREGGGDQKEEKRPTGPLVVIKRAAPKPVVSDASSAEAPEPGSAAATSTSTQEPTPVAATPPSVRAARPVTPAPSSALYEEVPENESFAEMFEQSAKQEPAAGRKGIRVGAKVKGKIFQLGADTAFVTLATGKSEAMIDLRELKDDEGILRHGVGDEIEAHVIEAGAGGIYLSRMLTKGSASMAMLAEARASGMPVEGLVLSVNKGGLEIAIGDVRAFCPVSQIDVRFVEKPDQFVGEKLKFRVTELRDKNVVVSRRSLLEEEQKILAAETRKNLAEGRVLKGRITGVRDFGAFVDLGGVEGLIPVSELAHTRIGHPSEVVKVGDEIEVEVLRLEPPNPNSPDKAKQKERITLSLRSRLEDPWKVALAEIKEGERLKGKVVRLQPFGAFVELRPGVDGLIHVSALANRRIAHPRDAVNVGDEVEVAVEKVDSNEKRIGLRLIVDGQPVGGDAGPGPISDAPAASSSKTSEPREQAPRPRAGQVVTGKIDRIEQYGVFLAFPGGKGLIPGSETGTDRGTDLRKAFSIGQEVKAQILEIEHSGKIRLSITGAVRAEERADMEAWKATQPKGGGKQGFGTFADLLKNRKV